MVVLLTVAGIGGAVALAAMLAFIISPGFAELEQRATASYRSRLHQRLTEFATTTQAIARDQAEMAALAAPSARHRDDWMQSALAIRGVETVAYRRPTGTEWAVRMVGGPRDEPIGLRQAMTAALEQIDREPAAMRDRNAPVYLPFHGDVLALGLATIAGRDGGAAGRLAIARRLTARDLSDALGQPVGIERPAAVRLDTIRRQSRVIDIMEAIPGVDRRPVATATIRVSREVVLLGRRVLLLAVAGSILLLVFLLVMLRRALGTLVLSPLNTVERHMRRVQASGVLLPFEDGERRSDEFGALGQSFNAMLSQLKDLREQNEIQSFALGRSESAVAVLHNVRNALAPLGTILSSGATSDNVGDRQLVDRAVTELGRDDIPPERRAKLVTFVRTALAADTLAREAVRRQLLAGRDAMRQTLEIIGAEQVRAHERPPRSRCDISEIVARNATIARYARSVSIAFNFPAHPAHVLANRVILSQVIGNLLSNAVEAIVATGREHGSILVEVLPVAGGRVVTRIIDDGEGFPPALVTQLFQPGFSTRTDKSGGLGLHWCANSMAAMGGTLELQSAGPGMGAMAVLTLDADFGTDGASLLAA
ncbi:ATP-binding protein [Sphingomonas sp. Leaf21]|uniref:ATP-binding protein n=1 Tax=Sphingomonas sp. Leaf21 TaxID=2876550 RepID=UPI001E50FD75|nr:ATP-binding protein [Sphingomonas sp. Leaf21]